MLHTNFDILSILTIFALVTDLNIHNVNGQKINSPDMNRFGTVYVWLPRVVTA